MFNRAYQLDVKGITASNRIPFNGIHPCPRRAGIIAFDHKQLAKMTIQPHVCRS
jgi:hypothetical protein